MNWVEKGLAIVEVQLAVLAVHWAGALRLRGGQMAAKRERTNSRNLGENIRKRQTNIETDT